MNIMLPLLSISLLASCSGGPCVGIGATSGVTSEINPKIVAISSSVVVPTNNNINGRHLLAVNNLTEKDLILTSYNVVSDHYTNDDISKTRKINVNSAISLSNCNILKSNNACQISFVPEEQDGSMILQLEYSAKDGSIYKAVQLVEYSSRVNKYDGFIVSNANIGNIFSTNQYSIAIPFVADDDYQSIEVLSKIKPLSYQLDCADGLNKNEACTAILTLPAESQIGYSNEITIKGLAYDGVYHQVKLDSGNTYAEAATLSINQWSSIILPTENGSNSSKTIRLVNCGTKVALKVADSLQLDQTWLNGGINNHANSIAKKIVCDGKDLSMLPELINPGSFCEISFVLKDTNSVGAHNYAVSYDKNILGLPLTTLKSKVYYLGPQDAHALINEISD